MFCSFFFCAPLPVVTQQLVSLLLTFFFHAPLFLNGALMCFSVFSLSERESVFVLFFLEGVGVGFCVVPLVFSSFISFIVLLWYRRRNAKKKRM